MQRGYQSQEDDQKSDMGSMGGDRQAKDLRHHDVVKKVYAV